MTQTIEKGPEITVVYAPRLNTKTLLVDSDLVLCAEGNSGDPLYLVDEAARQLAESHRVSVRQVVCDAGGMPVKL